MSRSFAHLPSIALPPRTESWTVRLGVLAAQVVREWRLRRDVRHLEELDSAALRDIGLSPGGLEGAVRYGRRGRPDLGEPRIPAEPPRLPLSVTEWR